jgi:hypothetical protein
MFLFPVVMLRQIVGSVINSNFSNIRQCQKISVQKKRNGTGTGIFDLTLGMHRILISPDILCIPT